MNDTGKSRTAVLAFLALALAWGSSFLFIKVGLEGLSPTQVVLARIVLGALTLVVIMTVTRRAWPRELRVWGHMSVVGIFFCVVPFTLYSWAEQTVPSSLASIYNATTPIMTLLLTPLLLRNEKLGRAKITGLVIGILGVVVLMGPWQLIGSADLDGTGLAQLACLGATLSYGFAGVYMRRFTAGLPYDSITLSSVQLVTAAGVVLVLAPFDARDAVSLSFPIVGGLLVMGVVSTGLAYIWFTVLNRNWGAARASTVTYVSPVVGVILGVLILGEQVHWYQPVGGAIVILGILASQGVVFTPKPTPVSTSGGRFLYMR